MSHIEEMARAIHDGPLGADDHDFDAPENAQTKQYCEDLAQAAFDALIDAAPVLVWDECAVETFYADVENITYAYYPLTNLLVVSACRMERGIMRKDEISLGVFNSTDFKAAANTHNREQARKLWETTP